VTDLVLRPSEVARFADCELACIANSSTLAPLVLEAGYTLNDCPLHVAAPIGTGTHAGVAHGLYGKLIARPAHLQDCIDAGVAAYEHEIEQHGGYSNMKWDATSRPSDAHKQIARMVRSWIVLRLPAIEPVEIERRRTIALAPGVKLSGQLDVAIDTPSAVGDLKTTAEVKNHAVQLGEYGFIREHVMKHEVEQLFVDHVPRMPLSREQTPPKVYLYDARACITEAKATLSRLLAGLKEWHARRFDKRLAFRANPSSPLCSRTWCRAHGTDFCPISKLRIAA
jgi:hypothetical protein